MYRLGEFAQTAQAKPPPVPGFELVGNLLIDSPLLVDFRQVAATMKKDPRTNETLNFLLTAKPNFLGHPQTPGQTTTLTPTLTSPS